MEQNGSVFYQKEIPLAFEYDVLVAGGGPAGICAAVSAARMGKRVLLIERFGVLGGNLTVGLISPILGKVSGGTMYEELRELFEANHRDARQVETRNGREIHLDHEEAKEILTRFVTASGAKFLLCASVADVLKTGNRVEGLILSTPSGLIAVRGKVVIDATGDGEVAYLAGAEIQMGDRDGAVQPFSIEFLIDHVDDSRALTAWGGTDPVQLPDGKEYRVLCKEKNAAGELPPNVTIVRLHRTFRDEERSVNATQVNGYSPVDPFSLSEAEAELREQIPQILAFLQKNVPGYENARVKSSASMVGVRESRRVIGDYILSDRDVETGAVFPDAVVHKAWFLIDIHNPRGGGQAEGFSHPAVPYDIPYRAMLPKGLENLLTAGRCISGTHRAHASYRVMAICMAMGEAAGVAAALAETKGISPREVPASEIRAELLRRGVEL